MQRYFRLISILLFAVLAASDAVAQFPGDVYFREPSVSVAEGETVTLEILTFTGVEALGAVQFELLYDSAELVIDRTSAGSSDAFSEAFVPVATPDGLGIVSMNHASIATPIGTVSLAEIEVRPLLAAGSRILIDLQVGSMLDGASQAMAPTRGFGAEILVVSADAGAPEPDLSYADPTTPIHSALLQRASTLRRPGAYLRLIEPYWGWKVCAPREIWVQTHDPRVPRENP